MRRSNQKKIETSKIRIKNAKTTQLQLKLYSCNFCYDLSDTPWDSNVLKQQFLKRNIGLLSECDYTLLVPIKQKYFIAQIICSDNK